MWNVIGVMNMESSLHIEYSLGSSSPWHSFWHRGDPGEVVRHWWVPIYDQWSGLGYRLPTQGLLTDTPLAYLALILPINGIRTLVWFGSLWFMFSQVHRWIASWVKTYQIFVCVFVDLLFLGLLSFYTLWHGWQLLPIQVAGGVVCIVNLTSREVISDHPSVPVALLLAKISLGMLMLLMPHVGYGMTFAPFILLLIMISLLSQKAYLARRALEQPIAFVVPLLALCSLIPGVFDLLREASMQRSLSDNYEPEFGIVHYLDTSWQPNTFIALTHTFIFPLVAVIFPLVYRWTDTPSQDPISFLVHNWPFNRVQFHGGILAIVMVAWACRRPISRKNSNSEIVTILTLIICLLVALLNSDNGLNWFSLTWIPMGMLSNGRWFYADLALILTVVLFVIHADDLLDSVIARSVAKIQVSFLLRAVVVIALVIAGALFPYRVLEPWRINGGQVRFAPLQAKSQVRSSNEEWRKVVLKLQNAFAAGDLTPSKRVLIYDMIGGEGKRSWLGLRSHSQLRDIKIASLLSWPRLRSAETLNSGDKLQHVVSDVECSKKLPGVLDFLGVDWSVVPVECSANFAVTAPQGVVPNGQEWSIPSRLRTSESVMLEMHSSEVTEKYLAIATATFHHWWASKSELELSSCHFLEQDCIEQLGLIAGSKLDESPFRVGSESNVAEYRLSQSPPDGDFLVIPLNYDRAIQAELDGAELKVFEFGGLSAIDGRELRPGRITFTIHPDSVMLLRALAPLSFVAVLVGVTVFAAREKRQRSSRNQTMRRD